MMAKRVLMAIDGQTSGDLSSAARSAAMVARESGGLARMVWVRPIPRPRLDRYDRVVADEDREMARLAADAERRMGALRWEFGDVPVEAVVRFGRLAAELAIEARAFGADLVGLAAGARPGPGRQLRAWYLGRAVRIPVVLLPLVPADAPGADVRRDESVILPAFR
jgi:hypothetical protein